MSRETLPGQTKMEAAQDAAVAMLDELNGLQLFGDRVGMITFVAGAELWSPLTDINDAFGFAALRAQWANDLDWCNRSYDPWDTAYGGAYYHDAPQMLDCSTVDVGEPPTDPSDAGTKQASGMEQALDLLAAEGNANAVKTIILVSDGLPQCVPSDPGGCNQGREDAGYDARARAEDEGVIMFSVNINDNPPQQAQIDFMCDMTNPQHDGGGDCTTGNDRFFDYQPGGGVTLTEIFLEIARAIPVALVR